MDVAVRTATHKVICSFGRRAGGTADAMAVRLGASGAPGRSISLAVIFGSMFCALLAESNLGGVFLCHQPPSACISPRHRVSERCRFRAACWWANVLYERAFGIGPCDEENPRGYRTGNSIHA